MGRRATTRVAFRPITYSRRQFLKATSATIIGAGVVGSATAAPGETENGWTQVESPTGKTLNGAGEAANGPWAAGGGGDVIERTADGWVKRLEYGPAAEGNELTCMGVTDDGRRVWFAGGSGVIGEMDVVTKTLTDYSAPKGKTSTWEAIAVTGVAEENEIISLVNGSGEELTGYRQPDGSIKWGDVVKPGGGASIKGADHYGPESFMCADTNAKVYESTDAAESWDIIGIKGGEVGLYAVAAVSADDANVAGGGGMMFRWDGHLWTGRKIASTTIRAVDRTDELGLASGGSGYVFRWKTIGSWEQVKTPTGNNLNAVVLGDSSPDVAVGSSGTIVEKQT